MSQNIEKFMMFHIKKIGNGDVEWPPRQKENQYQSETREKGRVVTFCFYCYWALVPFFNLLML